MVNRFKCHHCGSADFIIQEDETIMYFYKWDKKKRKYIHPPDYLCLQSGKEGEAFCKKCGTPFAHEEIERFIFNEL